MRFGSGVLLLTFRISAGNRLPRGAGIGETAKLSHARLGVQSQDYQHLAGMMKLLMASADVHSLRRITSRQNALLKQVRQAFSRAERTPEGLAAIEGFKTVDEAIRRGLKVHAAIFSDSGRERATHLLPQLPGKAET